MAVVALMDANRLWFKSQVGFKLTQIERQHSVCAYTINTPDHPTIISDLHSDARFAANPLVTGAPHLRFYAGVPLVDEAGLVLGTLAVFDTHPRAFSSTQRQLLGDMSIMVMTALQARRRSIELKRLALTDDLTGIANRAQFDLANSTEMNVLLRTGIPYTVVCLDLDGFKSVNDNFGHGCGDQVLREVAQRLNRQVRSGDLLARLSGDEFAVVARNCDKQTAKTMLERFDRALMQPIQLASGHLVQVGMSRGIYTASDQDDSADGVFEKADKALYRSKFH
jgi:diguanylate cyclase (GGDEF)-like protein